MRKYTPGISRFRQKTEIMHVPEEMIQLLEKLEGVVFKPPSKKQKDEIRTKLKKMKVESQGNSFFYF